MRERVTLHEVSLRKLVENPRPIVWQDPALLAYMNENKRIAMRSNPLQLGLDEPGQIIATIENQVVGRLDLLSGEVWVGDSRLRMSWASHLIVDPRMRRQGIGRMLLERQRQIMPCVGACGFTTASLRVARTCGWTCFRFPRLVFPRRTERILRRVLPHPVISRALSKVADLPRGLLPVVARRLRSWGRRRVHCRGVGTVSRELDPLLEQTTRRICPHRSAAWINWLTSNRLDEDSVNPPEFRREAFLIEDATGEPMAYFLTKTRRYRSTPRYGIQDAVVAALADWIIFDEGAISERDVILCAIEHLCTDEIDLLMVYPQDRTSTVTLLALGFLPHSTLDVGFAAGNHPRLATDISQRNDWRLRPAEGDNFFN